MEIRHWRAADESGFEQVLATPSGSPDEGLIVGEGADELEAFEDFASRYAAVPLVTRGPWLEAERRLATNIRAIAQPSCRQRRGP
jgi:hypothetical protein